MMRISRLLTMGLLVCGAAGCGTDDTASTDTASTDTASTDTGQASTEDTGTSGGTTGGTTGGTDAGTTGTDAGDGTGQAGGQCESDAMFGVSGVVQLYPFMAELDPEATLDGSEVLIRDPILSVQNKPSLLVDGDCNEARALVIPLAEDPRRAEFSFESLDVHLLTVGLIGTIDDPENATEDKWLRSSAGLAAGQPAADVTGAVLFAVSVKALETIAPLVPGADGAVSTAASLNERGVILGMFLDQDGEPVEGVVLVNNDGVPVENTIYPSADWTVAQPATSTNGAFALPEAPLKAYTGQKEGWTFAVQQAATATGGAFLLTLLGSAD